MNRLMREIFEGNIRIHDETEHIIFIKEDCEADCYRHQLYGNEDPHPWAIESRETARLAKEALSDPSKDTDEIDTAYRGLWKCTILLKVRYDERERIHGYEQNCCR